MHCHDWPAQPATKPRAPRAKPPQAPVTLEPDSSVERKLFSGGDRERTPRTAKLQKLNPQTPRQQSNEHAASTWDDNMGGRHRQKYKRFK